MNAQTFLGDSLILPENLSNLNYRGVHLTITGIYIISCKSE